MVAAEPCNCFIVRIKELVINSRNKGGKDDWSEIVSLIRIS